MILFAYQDGTLHAEGVPLDAVAKEFGTPCYVYSRKMIEHQWQCYDQAFGNRPHLVCYAVKANPALAVLNLLARLGSGFDIVSAGELERVLAAGGDAERTVFSGVGKREDEIRRALLVGVRCFNVESLPELDRINAVAGELGKVAAVAIRVNPDVDPRTHPYIATGLKENKFGIQFEHAREAFRVAATLPNLRVTGMACHVGSQVTALEPYLDAAGRLLNLTNALREDGITLQHLDLGGGLGIRYRDESPPEPAALVSAVCNLVADSELEIALEPGRSIVGEAGLLLTRVEYLKANGARQFAVVDAGMNDMLRPALYGSWHDIVPVRELPTGPAAHYDVVGPVCESADFLGRERALAISAGDLLGVACAGAYTACMGSNYNARSRAAEVMVDGSKVHLVRRRETIEEQMAAESLLP